MRSNVGAAENDGDVVGDKEGSRTGSIVGTAKLVVGRAVDSLVGKEDG